MDQNDKVRIQKYMAECGIASRRKSEELIARNKVKVNGRFAQIGEKINPAADKIYVNGKRITQQKIKKYIMLNKPRGFVTTMNDEMGRKCVAQLVQDIGCRIYPVGRLDKDSEGLLLLTNDGEFANALTHPAKHVSKTYRLTIKPDITESQITQMAQGIMIDGKKTAPAIVREIKRESGRVVLEIVLYEGRNRQIRKMCEALGLEAARLKRTAVGSLKLGMLQTGKWRELDPKEVKKLKDSALEKSSM